MGYWPDPTPFDAEDGSISSSLDDLISGPGAALSGLLLLGDAAADAAPAARAAAIRLARAWVRTGRGTVLVDLEFASPGLHQLLEVPNDEGVADHFAFGTSFSRLGHPVEDGAWSLVPAGAWVEDAQAVLRSPGWSRLLQECADADATLLVYCPADAVGASELADRIGAVVLLGGGPDLPGIRPFSVLGRFELPLPERPAEEPSPEPAAEETAAAAPEGGEREASDAAFERIRLPTDARAREALIADLRYRQRAARMAPPSEAFRRPSLADVDVRTGPRSGAGAADGSPEPGATVPPPPDDIQTPALEDTPAAAVTLAEPPPPQRRQPARRSYTPLWWTLAVVGLLSLLAGSWHLVRIRRQARLEADSAAASLEIPLRLQRPAATLPARPPAPDTVLGYAVSVGEHVRLPNAEQRLAALRAALPGARFFISPVVRDEALYYEVLAGPTGDSASARALRDSMSARAPGRRGVAAEVRLAPYAFLLGEYATGDSADVRVSGLRRLEIPSYTLPVAGPPTRVRVYAGSYTGPVDAEVMKQILQSVGEPAVLVPRLGKR